jgi:hypothetical protein
VSKVEIYANERKEMKESILVRENKEFSLKNYILENLSKILVFNIKGRKEKSMLEVLMKN